MIINKDFLTGYERVFLNFDEDGEYSENLDTRHILDFHAEVDWVDDADFCESWGESRGYYDMSEGVLRMSSAVAQKRRWAPILDCIRNLNGVRASLG